MHSRTAPKTVETLLGYITTGNATRCATFGVTINRETLPWHRRYNSFIGKLPNIATRSAIVSGASWNLREPTFGATCRVSNASAIGTYAISRGTVTQASVSGTALCSITTGTLSGSTINVDNRAGARLTVTLI